MTNELQLFKVETRGCGDFLVVSTDFNAAAQAVSDELNAQDYGYSNDRVVTRVEFLMRQQWMSNGKRALYGDKNENHLLIVGTTDVEAERQKIARKMAKLEEKEAELEITIENRRVAYEKFTKELEEKVEREIKMKPANSSEFSEAVGVLAKHYIESDDEIKGGSWMACATDTSKGRYGIEIDIRPVEGKYVKRGMQTIRPKKEEYEAVVYAHTMVQGIAMSDSYSEDVRKEAFSKASVLDKFISRMFIDKPDPK